MENGIYIHIPFCEQKCGYCDFHSVAGLSRWPLYTQVLKREMDIRPSELRFSTVYFGGGTPSLPDEQALPGIINVLKAHYRLDEGAEITTEANPNSLTLKKLIAWREAGINRISIGAQAAQPEHLKWLGRTHNFDDVRRAVDRAKKAGICRVSLDLIYGLPEQSLTQWQESLSEAVALGVEHISCYALTLSPGTPLYACQPQLPDADAQADMLEAAEEYLEGRGLRRYEISNWGKPCRHNLIYWEYGYWLGLGASAHGHLPGLRYANTRLEDYIKGSFEAEYLPLIPLEEAREAIMMGLRLVDGIDMAAVQERFQIPLESLVDLGVAGWLEAGQMLHREGRMWHLSRRGLAVQNALLIKLLND